MKTTMTTSPAMMSDKTNNVSQPLPDGFRDVVSDEMARRLLDLVFGVGEVSEMVKKLKTLSNRQLAALLVDHVWAYLPGGSPQSKLMDEVIDRLQGPEEFTEEECNTPPLTWPAAPTNPGAVSDDSSSPLGGTETGPKPARQSPKA